MRRELGACGADGDAIAKISHEDLVLRVAVVAIASEKRVLDLLMWKPIDKPMVQAEHPLEAEILSLAAQSYKLAHDLLAKRREFDEAHGWDGFASCAHWLSFKTSLDMGAAREKVRTAHALKDLPKIAAKFATGQLSYSKVRALTRIATPAIESDLLDLAEAATVEQVERLVRGWRTMNRADEKKREEHRRCHISTDADGMCRVTAILRPEEGALLAKAIAAVREKGQSLADALVAMAERSVCASEQAEGERYQVIVHREEEGASVEARFGEKVRVSAEVFEQLSCDASTVEITHDSAGAVLDVGHKTRRISAKLRMALSQRDACCRFPGCTNQHVQMHHVQHWSRGGPTDTGNLISLCAFHHGVIHREEARLSEDQEGGGSLASGATAAWARQPASGATAARDQMAKVYTPGLSIVEPDSAQRVSWSFVTLMSQF